MYSVGAMAEKGGSADDERIFQRRRGICLREVSPFGKSSSCRKSNLSAHGEREEESKSQTSFVDCGDVRVVVSTLLTSVPCGT